MGVYKQMYPMLFNGISKVIEEMKAVQCAEQIVESYLFALCTLQQQCEELYLNSDED